MSMTTNDQKRPDQRHGAEDSSYTLVVKAQVEIMDRSGTTVPARSMAAAIRSIRSRFHEDFPLIALDAKHAADPLFSDSIRGWIVTETAIMPIEGQEVVQEPDYRLRYHSFTLADPNASPHRETPCQAESLIPVAMKAADSAGSPVQLSSTLLGFTHPVLQPGDAERQQSGAEQKDTASILDSLDPDLFSSSDSRQLILVHPLEPRRHANTVTIPAATGVTYNAKPGDYPIDGEGVSVTASPADGYRFPEGETTHWDFEYQPDHEPIVETSPVVGELAEIVEEEEPNAPTTDAPDHDDKRSWPRQFPKAKALVLPASETPPWWKRRNTLIIAAAALVTLLIAGLLLLPQPGANDESGTETAQRDGSGWISSVAPASAAEESLTEEHTLTMWDLDVDQSAELSWYSAGVAHIDPDDDALVLRSTLSGEETARIQLDEPVQWTSEFMATEAPAVGARTESRFVAITADGDTASWPIDEDATLQVSGSTPMLTTDDGETYALIVGEEDPVLVEGNPEYRAAAIDEETGLIQFAAGMPRVVTLPMNDGQDPAELRLESPTAEASFGRHLAAGHGLTLTEWDVAGQDYLVVHDLDDATVTAAVPSIEDAQGWSIGRGMDIAIIGPYAFDLETGELVAESESQDFISALGDVAITQGEEGREFILDGESFYETSRVIGYTGAGTVIIRQADGSVAALSEGSGTV